MYRLYAPPHKSGDRRSLPKPSAAGMVRSLGHMIRAEAANRSINDGLWLFNRVTCRPFCSYAVICLITRIKLHGTVNLSQKFLGCKPAGELDQSASPLPGSGHSTYISKHRSMKLFLRQWHLTECRSMICSLSTRILPEVVAGSLQKPSNCRTTKTQNLLWRHCGHRQNKRTQLRISVTWISSRSAAFGSLL